MIYKISEVQAIEPIVKMFDDRKDLFNIPPKKVRDYMANAIQDKLSIILIDEKDHNLNGFLFASVEDFNGEEVCFIHTCIIVPDMKYTGHDFIARLKKWSIERNIKTIFMSTKSHKDGFERKYGFKFHSTLMSLPVDK